MKDVLSIALFDGAPIVLGEVVRPEPANKVDHVAAFECGDHQVDGSVRSPVDFFDLLRSIHRAKKRTSLSATAICMAVCTQSGIEFPAGKKTKDDPLGQRGFIGASINNPFPEALIPQLIVLCDAIKA